MAASVTLLKKSITFSRLIHLRRAVLNGSRSFSNAISDEAKRDEDQDKNPKVGMSADGRTLICWHPEPTHPYEHTQPINYDNAEAREGDVPLQRRLLKQYETKLRKDGPTDAELTRITFTTKHQWFSKRSQQKFKTKFPKVEREGL